MLEFHIREDTKLVVELWDETIKGLNKQQAEEMGLVTLDQSHGGHLPNSMRKLLLESHKARRAIKGFVSGLTESKDVEIEQDYDADEEDNASGSLAIQTADASSDPKPARKRVKKTIPFDLLTDQNQDANGKSDTKRLKKTHKQATMENIDLDYLCETWFPE